MATARRGPRLNDLRAQGTPIAVLDVPEAFKKWLSANRMLSAEAVYGYFYSETPEKDATLRAFELNYQRLYDRLRKVIPGDKVRQLNKLATEHYEIGEA